MPRRIDTRPIDLPFEWDETKNRSNIRKHGLDFVDAPLMFNGYLLVSADERENYGENRWIGIGMIRHRVAVVVFTEIGRTVRIISLRKATRNEREQYEKALQNELEAG